MILADSVKKEKAFHVKIVSGVINYKIRQTIPGLMDGPFK